jgi:hypothetical protein
MRDARIFPIYEGTNGIQANDLVGRKVMRDRGESMGEFLTELRDFETLVENHSNTAISSLRRGFSEALVAFEDATQYLLVSGNENPNAPASASFNYMMCMGVLTGGWLMLKSAVAAQAKIDAGSDDAFYMSKIATAQFYVEQILPRALAHKTAVMSGADSIMAMPAEAF